MKLSKSSLLSLSLFLILPFTAFGEALVNHAIHQDYMSIRAAGMGNAFTAVSDDYSTMFYNPAGLASLKNGTINMFIMGGISGSFLELSNDVKNVGGATETQKNANMSALIQSKYDSDYFSRVGLGAIWARPRWAVAIIPLDFELNMSIHQGVGPTVNVEGNQTTTIAYAYGRHVKWHEKHEWSWGATVKGMYRGFVAKNISATELAGNPEFFKGSDAKEGLGIDADISLMFEPKYEKGFMSFAAPTFVMAIRNLADLGFKQNMHFFNKESTEPPEAGRRLDFGSKWQLPSWKIFTVRGMVDVRDIGHKYWNYMKGLHVGAEFEWNISRWWRGGWRLGLNQGYWTAGFTGKILTFMLDLATWGEEVGTLENTTENRRYMFNASLDF